MKKLQCMQALWLLTLAEHRARTTQYFWIFLISQASVPAVIQTSEQGFPSTAAGTLLDYNSFVGDVEYHYDQQDHQKNTYGEFNPALPISSGIEAS